jgi:hypothetical protein
MKPTEAQIAERLPVWEALSEFFLDTRLRPRDCIRISQKLAATRFSESEIEEILICEVCPVCRRNALSIADEWLGFSDEWLKENIAPGLGKNLRWNFGFACGTAGCTPAVGTKPAN